MLTDSIKQKINQLWDKFWAGGMANPIVAIEQISYLLFMRRLEALDGQKQKNAEISQANYTSIFSKEFHLTSPKGKPEKIDATVCKWSYFKELEDEELLNHIRTIVFPFIKQLNDKEQPFSLYMENAYFAIPKPSLLKAAITTIGEIYQEISKQEAKGETFQDTQGDLYEYLLNEISRAGKNGQFRTPRHIIQLMCALVKPDVSDKICDYACGTGGFLVGCYQYILTQYTSEQHLQIDRFGFKKGVLGDLLTAEQTVKLNTSTFYGYDFDTTMVRIGLMNLMLHGIESPQIHYRDTLSKKFDEPNTYTLIMANPPFKGSIDYNDVNPHLKENLRTKKTELLFIEQAIRMLKIGGRSAIIVPDGVLFGSSRAHVSIRKKLLQQCDLKAIVSMPSGVFKPYAGVSTAIIVFEKKLQKFEEKKDKPATEKVWFYEMEADGFTLDDKRQDVEEHDLLDISEQYDEKGDDGEQKKNFYVPYADIEENGFDLSINFYKKIEYEEIEYEAPAVLIAQLEVFEKEIGQYLKDVKSLLQ